MLQVRDLAVDVAGRRVLTDATFIVALGDKVGLVGRNGAGKTSLLKVLAGEDDPAAGLVPRRGTLGFVPETPRPRRRDAPPPHPARGGPRSCCDASCGAAPPPRDRPLAGQRRAFL